MSRYRFVIVGLAFVVILVNYLDRGVASFAIKPISDDFGLTNTTFGLVISTFALGAVAVNAISGWILDRTSVKLVWTASIFLWSVVMVLLGSVSALAVFLVLRFLLGIGEGVTFPAMNRSMADWMAPSELGRSTSITLLGVPMALLVGSPILATVITEFGWRSTFAGLGVLGVIVGLAMVVLYRDGPRRQPAVTPEAPAQTLVPWRELLLDPTLLATSWSFFAFGYVLFFAISWVPGYFEQTYGLELTEIGWFATLPWALAIVLMPFAGWLSDRLMKRTGRVRSSRIHIIWVGQLLAVLFMVPLLFGPSDVVAVAFLSLAIGFSMMPNSPYYSICTDVFPRNAGAATGIMVSFFSVAGIVSPLLTGWLTDQFDGFGAAFVALIVIVSTAILGLILFAHPERRTPPAEAVRI
jgi:ACS family hexuronate transporter-like MFS transporter